MKYTQMIAIIGAVLTMMGCSDSVQKETATEQVTTVSVTHPLPGDPVAGKEVYARVCSACHQPDGSGMNGMLAANFVSDKSRLAKSNEVLLASMRDGIVADGKVMPPLKDVLTEEERKNALSYIRQTFGDK